jgi:hypothetical protein
MGNHARPKGGFFMGQSYLAALGIAAALAFGWAEQTSAAVILADATGQDNSSDLDFWGVTFQSGSGFIQSVTFDLTADPDGFFDFDGASFGTAGPLLGTLSGLDLADITFSTNTFEGGDPGHPQVLIFEFAAGSFGIGDSFRFAADTDFFVTSPTPGGLIGDGGAIFSAVLEGGESGSATFVRISDTVSEASADIGVAVPEPSMLALIGTGLAGIGFAMRRRREV